MPMLRIAAGSKAARIIGPLVSGLSLKGLRKDGRTFDASIALTPIETDDGLMIASAVREIGADRQTETYFRNLLESAPDALIIIDRDGAIEIVNNEVERMFCFSRTELLGQPIEMLLPERFRERHVGHRHDFLDSPGVRPMGAGMELMARRKDGGEFPVQISLSSTTGPSGPLACAVIRDVTENKKLQNELIDARLEAERANKANTAFLAAASHDLRQPVQALTLLNGALRRTLEDPLALEMVESQQLSLDAMTNLLNSLLDISRLDAGAIEPEVEDFSLQRLLDRQSAEFGRQARQKGLVYREAECHQNVRCDPNLLGEIVQNLVSNAIRYTHSGSVETDCEAVGEFVRIDIRDTGIGIPADQLDAIFQEFHQCKAPGASSEGFGLGLAIVRRLADLIGVQISVTSTVDEGSCFSVYVPLAPAGELTDAVDLPTTPARDVAGGGRIILIEDDVKVASAWRLLLATEGYHVTMAKTAREAVAQVRDSGVVPNLIVSDYHLLDDSTGIDAINAIRNACDRIIPAFIVSGDTSKLVDDASVAREQSPAAQARLIPIGCCCWLMTRSHPAS